MRALIQRVSEASVTVEGEIVGRIGRGILVLLGVEKGDDLAACHRLAEKVISYRIFPDEAGRMNRSVKGIGGGVLVVSQFTLVADTRKGLRPSFTPAADPGDAEALYRAFVAHIEPQLTETATGRFGADMQVALINDGPVTFLVDV